jgi:hypothetical protein
MHLGSAGIGETDVNTARHQGPHQTFRTVHRSTPVRPLFSENSPKDQSSPAAFVKGFADIAGIAASSGQLFLTAPFENGSASHARCLRKRANYGLTQGLGSLFLRGTK